MFKASYPFSGNLDRNPNKKSYYNTSSDTKDSYRFPLNLFMVFEHVSPVIWASSEDTKLDYFVVVPSKLVRNLSLYFKKSVMGNLSYVTDLTIAGGSTSLALGAFSLNNLSSVAILSIYSYHSRLRMHFVSSLRRGDSEFSVDSSYKNCNWLEREAGEMYGINYIMKGDSRRLLLNYFDLNSPMQKGAGVSSNYEVYYDFQDRQVQYAKSNRVEL